MASELKVNKISPESGTTLTLGDSGDTINFGSGVLPNFENLTVTGDLTVDTNSLKVDSTNNFVGIGTATPSVALDVVGAITATGNITGTLATAAQPNITSLGTLTGLTTTGNINLGDSDVINLGASNDLQIYHDGSNSYIKDVGTGNLFIDAQDLRLRGSTGEKYAVFIQNGSSTLYYDDAEKLATTSTGINVTGTAVTDGLTVDGNAQINGDITVFDGTTDPFIKLQTNEHQTVLRIDNDASDIFQIRDATNSANRLGISTGGDISFYEDTGTTPKFFWDASAESLGIGTSSPSGVLHLTKGTRDLKFLLESAPASGDVGVQIRGGSGDYIGIASDTGTGIVVDSSNKVGIGTSNPSAKLDIFETVASTTSSIWTGENLALVDDTAYAQGVGGALIFEGKFNSSGGYSTFGYIRGSKNDASDGGFQGGIVYGTRAGDHVFVTNSNGLTDGTDERMRIDSSGNVNIGNVVIEGESVKSKANLNLSADYDNDTSAGFSYMSFSTDGSEKMRLMFDGKVGIGTSSPDSRLEVLDSGATGIISRSTSTQATDTNKAIRVRNNSDTNTFSVSYKGLVTATAFSGDGSALTGVGGGITEADQWRLTSSFTGDASPISSNLSRVNTDGFGYIGTGMSQSSGVFTFPSTGIWLIKAVARFHWNDSDPSRFNECKIETTTNNSTYDPATNSSQAINVPYNQAETNSYGEFIFDVTSTSTHKVRFSIDVQNAGVTTAGNTGQNLTYFTFIRLGDT